ncbi:MAG: RNA-binding protein [Bdellovibrionales bacterium]|nr:RNA-binding protein [Bdellovibrionales bacterium]
MSKKLFVGNLPFEVNDADLSTVLSVAGKVIEAKVIINKKTGRSKGYGFVEMETEELALEAVKKFEGATLNERAITVQLATPKQEADAKKDDGNTEKAASVDTATTAQAGGPQTNEAQGSTEPSAESSAT